MSRSYHVAPVSSVGGTIELPGDKSVSHRALMLGGIAEGTTRISGFLDSADCLATLAALQALGVRIERPAAREVVVHGVGLHGLRAAAGVLDMGNAGTAIRLSMGLLAGQRFATRLIGDESLMRRPMERVAAPLRSMGASITTLDGCPPVDLAPVAALRAIEYRLPMASAQVKSAVLLAGLYAQGRTHVIEPAVTRDHTERMLGGFGIEVARDGGRVSVEGGRELRGTEIRVPGDFSSAAFFIVAGCIGAQRGLTLRNVGVNPSRTGLLDILELMGADMRMHTRTGGGPEPTADLELHAAPLRGIHVPPELVPLAIDEFPVLFIAAACATGETVVTGAQELRVKESDRLAVMAEGLARMGVEHELLPDGIRIQGLGGTAKQLRGARIASHGDHRIAMAFTVASLRAAAPLTIEDVTNVGTSFPDFTGIARAVGLDVEERAG